MKSCLVIDDDAVNRYTYVAMLKFIGLQAYESESAVDAMVICEKEMPDVILLDWIMPKINGIEFLESIRQTEKGKGIYIIMCSAQNTSEEKISESMKAGANAYMQKPFKVDDLKIELSKAGIL